jgi:hypothetical protein
MHPMTIINMIACMILCPLVVVNFRFLVQHDEVVKEIVKIVGDEGLKEEVVKKIVSDYGLSEEVVKKVAEVTKIGNDVVTKEDEVLKEEVVTKIGEVKKMGDDVVTKEEDTKPSLRQVLEEQNKKVETKEYDPKKCTNMVNGHCDDEEGGAWKYRDINGQCTYVEDSNGNNNAPQDWNAVQVLPKLFPNVQSVADFGGGPGTYLSGFRNKGVPNLVTIEPHPFDDCLFANLTQDMTDWSNTPLIQLPSNKFDLVMTIEVLEHIPVGYHEHIVKALAQATKEYVLFSAAHPGQDGEGHAGPSMKTRGQWTEEILRWTENNLILDDVLTKLFHEDVGDMLKTNSMIFRKKSGMGRMTSKDFEMKFNRERENAINEKLNAILKKKEMNNATKTS